MKRRAAQSSALSFMDCICCGFGAVLLLFILTAKRQIVLSAESAAQAAAAADTLRVAIETAEERRAALEAEITALGPLEEAPAASLAELAAERERLAEAVEEQERALRALEAAPETPEAPAAKDRPSADRNYLAGLRLRGPRAVIVLENSGSMLAETPEAAVRLLRAGDKTPAKWRRAKAAVRAVLAAIPKGTRVALLQMNESTTPLGGTATDPYFDPYDNAALLAALERLDRLEAVGGADLARAVRAIEALPERPNSLLLVGDGLPTAPAPAGGLSEADRVDLFNRATRGQIDYPFNVILLPFAGDPSAAGLFWRLSGRTNGITLAPDADWPDT